MKCPKCGCNEFDYGMVEIDFGDAWQVITCEECDYQFHAVYNFSFYEDRETGEMIEVEE